MVTSVRYATQEAIQCTLNDTFPPVFEQSLRSSLQSVRPLNPAQPQAVAQQWDQRSRELTDHYLQEYEKERQLFEQQQVEEVLREHLRVLQEHLHKAMRVTRLLKEQLVQSTRDQRGLLQEVQSLREDVASLRHHVVLASRSAAADGAAAATAEPPPPTADEVLSLAQHDMHHGNVATALLRVLQPSGSRGTTDPMLILDLIGSFPQWTQVFEGAMQNRAIPSTVWQQLCVALTELPSEETTSLPLTTAVIHSLLTDAADDGEAVRTDDVRRAVRQFVKRWEPIAARDMELRRSFKAIQLFIGKASPS